MSVLRQSQTAREAAGLSLEAAAKRARVSVAYLRSFEVGTKRPPYVLADRLARIYRCAIDVFLQ